MKALCLAEYMGSEANNEPRFHRAVWNIDFFNALVRSGFILRADLNMLEQVLKGRDGTYKDVFSTSGHAIREMESFQKVKKDWYDTMADVLNLVNTILKNETNKPM